MANRRRDEWDDDYVVYTPEQVEGVLDHIGVECVSETGTHFLCLCPFHGNTHDPAFVVDKNKGLFTCFNPACQISGTFPELVRRLTKGSEFQVQRTILQYKNTSNTPLADRLKSVMEKQPDFVEFKGDLAGMKEAFPGSIAESYMKGRGFDDTTLDYFDIGYSKVKNMVVVPMHDPNGMPIGLIGRSASDTDKQFKNSKKLPKTKTLFNFHRAKRLGGKLIMVEASFDAMSVHQAGYPNVCATLGGSFSAWHAAQVGKHFSEVIWLTDFDKKQYPPNCRLCKNVDFKPWEIKCVGHRPGRELARSGIRQLPNLRHTWGVYDGTCVYPDEKKDATDMTPVEIRQCLKKPMSNFEYSQTNYEK